MRKRATLSDACRIQSDTKGLIVERKGTYEDRARTEPAMSAGSGLRSSIGRMPDVPVNQNYYYQPLCERPSALPIRGGGGHLLLGA